MKKRKARKGYLFIEILAQRSKIQEKIDLGWTISQTWEDLKSQRKFSGSRSQFSRLIKKYLSTPIYLEQIPQKKPNKIDDKRSYEDFFYEKYKSKWGDNRVEFIDNLPEMAEIMQKVM